MKKLLAFCLVVLIALTACNASKKPATAENVASLKKEIVIIPKAPTATNFPRLGTPTSIPPTSTPKPTSTPLTRQAIFDDETLAELMAGTISSAGVKATVAIEDNRASGGERVAHITIVSKYNLQDNQLLLKLFVLEVGNALRTIRAFSEGDMQANLDAADLIVKDKQGNVMGTVSAPMPEIVRFLDGRSSVDEALAHLTLTGVFETFKK